MWKKNWNLVTCSTLSRETCRERILKIDLELRDREYVWVREGQVWSQEPISMQSYVDSRLILFGADNCKLPIEFFNRGIGSSREFLFSCCRSFSF